MSEETKAPAPGTLATVYASGLKRAQSALETQWQAAVAAENKRGNDALADFYKETDGGNLKGHP